jgi:uncharacterized damage-inducible protein DinB
LIAHFQLLAQYNQLANQKLYAACAQLSNEELKQVRPAFFKSIYGTLNHILVGDRIWLSRFEGKTTLLTRLDTILYDDFTDLHQARIAEDLKIVDFAAHLTAEFLLQSITYYRNNAGITHTDPLPLLIAHFFNHQTHHRGQIHDLLSQTTAKLPSLDMHRMIHP